MFGEVGSGRRARSLRWGKHQLYSQHLTSRICSNSLKTNDGRHVYPSQNREGDFSSFKTHRGEKFHFAFFTEAIRSKLARGSCLQESRSRCLAHRSR